MTSAGRTVGAGLPTDDVGDRAARSSTGPVAWVGWKVHDSCARASGMEAPDSVRARESQSVDRTAIRPGLMTLLFGLAVLGLVLSGAESAGQRRPAVLPGAALERDPVGPRARPLLRARRRPSGS
ncbi:hypothetical protein IN07_17215 [Modestobacter caceresii]|uniref:Uncharacterized protein n=1 Tax=Modestobacter caceresii TaxID=1522368 RepID=A0A098Y4S1_9ACTN|nr:hypothetical protein IN07_17215 [Modestobacter caceresii]